MIALLGLPTASSIARAIVNVGLKVFVKLLADAVSSLLDALFGFMAATTEPVFTSGWWTGAGQHLWLEVLSVSGAITVVAVMLAGLEAIFSGTVAPVGKALRAIPMAVVKTAALVSVVSLLISGSDEVSGYFDHSIVHELGAVPALIAAAVGETGIVGIVFAAVIILAVLGLWAELAVRAATIYLVVMTAPMVIAASIHPRLRDSWRKLTEIGAGLIFAKVLVALAFAVAFSELEGMSATPSFAQAVSALVAAITTLLLSCFAPYVVFRLFSLEVAHLEGLARRPGRAVRDAQQLAYYNRAGISSFLNRHGGSPIAGSLAGPNGPGSGGPSRPGDGTGGGGPRPGSAGPLGPSPGAGGSGAPGASPTRRAGPGTATVAASRPVPAGAALTGTARAGVAGPAGARSARRAGSAQPRGVEQSEASGAAHDTPGRRSPQMAPCTVSDAVNGGGPGARGGAHAVTSSPHDSSNHVDVTVENSPTSRLSRPGKTIAQSAREAVREAPPRRTGRGQLFEPGTLAPLSRLPGGTPSGAGGEAPARRAPDDIARRGDG